MALQAGDETERHRSDEAPPRRTVSEEVDLRSKSQLTVPSAIARKLGLLPGDRLVLEVLEAEPGVIRLRKLREDYSGALAGVYGTPEETADYLQGESGAWGP